MKTSRWAWVAAMLVAGSVGWAQTTQTTQPAPATQPTEDDALLADYFWRQTQSLTNAGPLGLQLAAEFYDAAIRLNPQELALLRGAIEVNLATGDRDRAGELLAIYRKRDPMNELTLVQSIDLKATTLESADQRAAYLADLVDRNVLSKPVRSHIAVLLQGVYREQGHDAQANDMLEKAIALDASNVRALQVKWQAVSKTLNAQQRVEMLSTLLRANPVQPGVASALGRELTAVGAFREALPWLNRASEMALNLGTTPPGDDLANLASALLIAGDSTSSAKISEYSLNADPFRSDALFLRLLADRASTGKSSPETINTARTLMMKRLDAIRVRLIGPSATQPAGEAAPAGDTTAPVASSEPSTMPVLQPLPDIAGDMGRLQGRKDEVSMAYYNWLADWAWLDVYFSEQPATTQVMDALASVLGEENPAIARLRGWSLWRRGEIDPAKLKLSAVADRDPLARLGLILIGVANKDDKAALTAQANKLWSDFPDGLTGASIWSSLATSVDLKLYKPDHDAVVRAVNVPEGWADYYKSPRNAYLLEVTPRKGTYAMGEPIWLDVTVSNVGDLPISIGNGAVLDANVVIDGQLRGLRSGYIPVAGVGQLTQKIVLQRHESVSAAVRVDGGLLGSMLQTDPTVVMTVMTNVNTNARASDKGMLLGPGGMHQAARRPFDRTAIRVSDPAVRQDLYGKLVNGTLTERLQAQMVLGAIAGSIAQQPEPTPDAAKVLAEIYGAMDRALESNQPPGLRALAQLQKLGRVKPEERESALKAMLSSPDWQARMIGEIALTNAPVETRAPYLTALASDDPDEQVRNIAKLLQKLPTATQPTTQPSVPTTLAPDAVGPGPANP